MKEISEVITAKLLPNPQDFIEYSAIYEEEKFIIKIEVKKGNKLYYIKKYGRSTTGCYLRVDTTCIGMTEDQIENRYLKTVNIPELVMTDVINNNQNLTFEILKISLSTKGFHVNDNSFYQNYNLLTLDNKFNLLANLFADVNNISVKVVKFAGKDKTDLTEKTEYGYVSIISAINRMIDRLEAINITKSVMKIPTRVDTRLVDMRCLKEAFLNSIAHNLWTGHTSPALYVFSDRIEILSHGGLPLGVKEDDFFLGVSKPRNESLMRILRDLDVVEQSGFGVPLIVKKYGEEAFQIGENNIRVILRFDEEVSKLLNNDQSVLKDVHKNVLKEDREKIIFDTIRDLIKNNDKVTLQEMSEAISMSIKSVQRFISEHDKIKRKGSRRNGYWEIDE